MKNLRIALFMVAALILSAGCSSFYKPDAEVATSVPDPRNIPSETKDAHIGDLRLPDKSKIILSEDGSSVTFIFPQGVSLFDKDSSGALVQMDRIVYTCLCNSVGGCDVIKLGNEYGCLHGTCQGRCTGGFTEEPPSPLRTISNTLQGGFADMEAHVAWVKTAEEMNHLLVFNPIILEQPEIKSGWQRFKGFVNAYYALNKIGEDEPLRMVALNLYGTLVAYPVRESFYQQMVSTPEGPQMRAVSCKCNTEQSGCDLEAIGSDFYICRGGECRSCSMIDDGPSKD